MRRSAQWKRQLGPFLGMVAMVLGLAWTLQAHAVEPGHWGPGDGSGHGLLINCNLSDECAVFWFNHASADEQVWLLGVPNCARGADEICDVSLTKPSAPGWNGAPGEVDIGESVGTLEITPFEDGTLGVDWQVIALFPDWCTGISVGGLYFRECIGQDVFHPIATNPPARE